MVVSLVPPNPANVTQTAAAGVDTSFTWGPTGQTAVTWLLLSNNSGANITFALNTSTGTIADQLADTQKIFFEDIEILSLHLASATQININGTTFPNISVWGAK